MFGAGVIGGDPLLGVRGTFESGATFSPCDRHRFALWRWWGDPKGPGLLVIGLNPSTADETAPDPTITRCVGYARAWGLAGLVMMNLFPFRSKDPKALLDPKNRDPEILATNDLAIEGLARMSTGVSGARVLAAWGVPGGLLDRDRQVMALLGRTGVRVEALKVTRAGFPGHPLYLRKDLTPKPYAGRP